VSHEELIALCGPYALGVLDGDERQEVGEHLTACTACRLRVLDFDETFAEGAKVLPPLQPSPQVKTQLMERISGSRRAVGSAEPAPRVGETSPFGWIAVAVIALVSFFLGVGATLLLQTP